LIAPCTLLAGTERGLVTIEIDSRGRTSVSESLTGENAVRAIAIDPVDANRVFVGCGLRGWGLFGSDDGAQSFERIGFADSWVWGIAIDPANRDRVLLGTEPPMLYESLDGGMTFSEHTSILEVPSRERWTFFHSPFHAGHVHAISITPERPDRIVCGVEHGALLVSHDKGESWHDAMPGADLHVTEVDPLDHDRIYAGAGNGLFLSTDGGEFWRSIPDLRGRYVHGIEIHPNDVNRMFVYVDSGHSPIHRSVDRGETWQPIGSGLPASRPADPVRLHPSQPDTIFYAGDKDGGSEIYVSTDGGTSWSALNVTIPKVWRLEILE
jgi:hypothetical protein